MACEECQVLKEALIPALKALDWIFYEGNAVAGAQNRFLWLTYQEVNELGAPIHEALLKLKGEES